MVLGLVNFSKNCFVAHSLGSSDEQPKSGSSIECSVVGSWCGRCLLGLRRLIGISLTFRENINVYNKNITVKNAIFFLLGLFLHKFLNRCFSDPSDIKPSISCIFSSLISLIISHLKKGSGLVKYEPLPLDIKSRAIFSAIICCSISNSFCIELS